MRKTNNKERIIYPKYSNCIATIRILFFFLQFVYSKVSYMPTYIWSRLDQVTFFICTFAQPNNYRYDCSKDKGIVCLWRK